MQSVYHEADKELDVKKNHCEAVELISYPKVGEGHLKEWSEKDPNLEERDEDIQDILPSM